MTTAVDEVALAAARSVKRMTVQRTSYQWPPEKRAVLFEMLLGAKLLSLTPAQISAWGRTTGLPAEAIVPKFVSEYRDEAPWTKVV